MYESLQRLAKLPDDTLVFPGHRYSLPSSGTMDAVRATNIVYKPKSKDGWLMMFGRSEPRCPQGTTAPACSTSPSSDRSARSNVSWASCNTAA
jgi:hypothetical protein